MDLYLLQYRVLTNILIIHLYVPQNVVSRPTQYHYPWELIRHLITRPAIDLHTSGSLVAKHPSGFLSMLQFEKISCRLQAVQEQRICVFCSELYAYHLESAWNTN